jgi:ATP-binding protein involved in chromosome partitioning
LTLVQQASVTGAVLVSTPQDVGLTISMKTYRMFLTARVRVLGIVENMSYYSCSGCGKREDIFGHGGAALAAQRLSIPFLGEIPLDTKIRQQADQGVPIVLTDENSSAVQAYTQIIKQLAAQISIASYQAAAPLKIIEEPV